MQFLLPVVLVRCLDADAFGEYRLLWLVAGTVLGIATLAMPQSLYYYLPRSDAAGKRLYVNQTLAFLAVAGLAAALAVSAWNPLLTENLRHLARHAFVLPAFIVLWVVASLLDMLPTAEERIRWQAQATISLAVLRAICLSLAALLTRELGPVLVALLAFVAVKVVLLIVYVAKFHGLRGPALRMGAFADQLRYAAPFGAEGALYALRTQSDQWVVAALFPLGLFAAFSIAAVLGPLMNLFRMSVNYAFLPVMSRRHAAGDAAGMLALNSRGNIMVGALVFPLFALAFVLAEDLVTLVYTANYLAAAPVIRIYIVGIAALAIELSSLTLLLRQSLFVMLINVVALLLAVSLNWTAALHVGLAGAALGTVAVIYLDRCATLWRISRILGVPIRRLQDWRRLALLLVFAMLSALFAWATVAGWFAASAPLTRVLVGTSVMAVAYGALVAISGLARTWFAALRAQPQGA